MISCISFVNGQAFLVISVAGTEITRVPIPTELALTLIALGTPLCP